MNYGQVFLNPQGRLGPSEFQQAGLILIAIGFVLAILPAISLAFAFLGIVSIILIYPWVVIWVKRLHDAGYSGWWFLLVILAWIVVGGIASSIVMLLFAGGVAATANGSGDFQSMMMGMTGARHAAVIPSAIVNALIAVGFVFGANAILKSDPAPNQYDEPTGGASSDPAPGASTPAEPSTPPAGDAGAEDGSDEDKPQD